MRLQVHKTLVIRSRRPYIAFTQFARACGRVLVGGHPDKRPDSRQGLEDGWRGWTSLKSRLPVSARRLLPDTDQQPEAKPANPESPRGTQLKATTNGLFWSRRPSKGRHRRGLFLLARRAVGDSPSNPRQLPGALRPRSSPRLQSAWTDASHRPLTPAARLRDVSIRSRARRWRLEPVVGTTNDRSHPRLPARAP